MLRKWNTMSLFLWFQKIKLNIEKNRNSLKENSYIDYYYYHGINWDFDKIIWMIKWKCKECVGLYCIRHKGNSTKWILGGITNRHQRKEKFKLFWHFEIIRGYSWFRLGISPWLRFKIFWEFMLRGNVCANISAEKKDVRTGVFRSNGNYSQTMTICYMNAQLIYWHG